MGITPAVELSYLNKEEQKLVYSLIIYEDLTPSHAQAINIRELGKKKKLNFDSLEEILMQKKAIKMILYRLIKKKKNLYCQYNCSKGIKDI